MNTDIRISVDFPTHHKTLKLIRRLGDSAPWALVRLWLYVAKYCPDGILVGMDHEDIEIAAGWNGEEDKFVPALVDIRWLDLTDGVLSCHDWSEHNPWASESEVRGDKARFSRLFKTAAGICRELKALGVDAIGKRDFSIIKAASTVQQSLSDIQNQLDIFNDRTTTVPRPYNDGKTDAHETISPAPAPAPAPAPKSKSKSKEKSMLAGGQADVGEVDADLTENQLRVVEALERLRPKLTAKYPLVDFELEKLRMLEKARASPILDPGLFVLAWFPKIKTAGVKISDIEAHNERAANEFLGRGGAL